MSVIPFARTRFTPADIAAFNEIALPRLASGHWSAVARHSGDWGDRIAIMVAGRPAPLFTFERDKAGRYALYFHDRDGAVRIGTADSAGACLAIWSSTSRRRTTSRGAA
ncbi:hypothetical protein [Azospirillum canadense]|uniref:hypothetical protein n=1 Tax=Azospirillum canadense TaxID=403962 RepID=UPI002226554E|nr:hypothetical protein [Azospirillum canadense]MCW2239254.1 hypothetical protein [Azospirillum canadense]